MTASTHDAALLAQALAWRDRAAHPDLRGLPTINVPALGRLRQAIPQTAATRALAAAYAGAIRLAQQEALLREAGVDSIAALREQPLARCDQRARGVARQSGWLAGGSGAALGVAGAAGLLVDAPALLLIALRALVRIGLCYGEAPSPALVAAVFALASADTDAEKQQAWHAALTVPAADGLTAALTTAAPALREAAIRDGLERAAEREFAKQALTGSLQKLATTLVQRLGASRAAGLLPLVGAVVGGAVNLRFVYLLGEAARMVFIARRLHAEGTPLQQLVQREALEAVRPTKPAAASARKRQDRPIKAKTRPAERKATRRRPAPAP